MTETSNKLEVNSENFNSRLASPIFDSGKSLRSILYKKGRGRRCSLFRPWEERFCILDRSILLLRYYDISSAAVRVLNLDGSMPPSQTLRGEISLEGCDVESLTEEEAGKVYAFRINRNGEEQFVMAALTQNVQEEWMLAFAKVTNEREKVTDQARRKISINALSSQFSFSRSSSSSSATTSTAQQLPSTQRHAGSFFQPFSPKFTIQEGDSEISVKNIKNQMEEFEELKELGNSAWRNGRYDEAIAYFSDAIDICNEKEIQALRAVYSNRSAAYMKISQFKNALLDADKCVKYDPLWSKGHVRRGDALISLKRYTPAYNAYSKAQKLTPDDQAVIEKVDMSIDKIRSGTEVVVDEEEDSSNSKEGQGNNRGGDINSKASREQHCIGSTSLTLNTSQEAEVSLGGGTSYGDGLDIRNPNDDEGGNVQSDRHTLADIYGGGEWEDTNSNMSNSVFGSNPLARQADGQSHWHTMSDIHTTSSNSNSTNSATSNGFFSNPFSNQSKSKGADRDTVDGLPSFMKNASRKSNNQASSTADEGDSSLRDAPNTGDDIDIHSSSVNPYFNTNQL